MQDWGCQTKYNMAYVWTLWSILFSPILLWYAHHSIHMYKVITYFRMWQLWGHHVAWKSNSWYIHMENYCFLQAASNKATQVHQCMVDHKRIVAEMHRILSMKLAGQPLLFMSSLASTLYLRRHRLNFVALHWSRLCFACPAGMYMWPGNKAMPLATYCFQFLSITVLLFTQVHHEATRDSQYQVLQ